jgi:hypothetical protein
MRLKPTVFLFIAVFCATWVVSEEVNKSEEPSLTFPVRQSLEVVESASVGPVDSVAQVSGKVVVREVKRGVSLPASWLPIESATPGKISIEVANKMLPTTVRPHDRNFAIRSFRILVQHRHFCNSGNPQHQLI